MSRAKRCWFARRLLESVVVPNPLVKKTISVVHVVDSLELGGLERVTVDLAKAQQRAGYKVAVFSILTTRGLKQELLDQNIPVVEGHKDGTLDRKVILALRRLIQSQDANVIHAHNFVPNYYAALARLGLVRKSVQICTCHDMGTRLSGFKLRWLFKLSLLKTHKVAMVGKQVFDRYMDLGLVSKDRAHIVLNGIPIANFVGSAARRQRARESLKLEPNELLIGCVGRLVELKNHRRMIEVMPDLIRSFPGVRLVIVGDGDLRRPLTKLIEELNLTEQVRLLGARNDVSSLLPAFDVFALPSQTEGLSIALLEACAAGVAVLATDVGGNREIVEDGVTGLLVPSDDNQALAFGLTRLLGDTQLRYQLGNRASDWVVKNASDEALQLAYEHLYTSNIGARQDRER